MALENIQQSEEWRDVPGYEGLYRVSNLGRMYACDRIRKHWKGGDSLFKGSIMSPSYNKKGSGYYQINLKGSNGILKCFFIHQLVMLAFVGPSNGMDIDHLNMISTDNRLCNLQYVTHKENVIRGFASKKDKTTSKYVGVSLDSRSGKWHSYSANNSQKRKNIGYFNCETRAYIERLNFERSIQ